MYLMRAICGTVTKTTTVKYTCLIAEARSQGWRGPATRGVVVYAE